MAGMAPRIITPRRSALPAAVLPSARHWPCRRASRSSLRTRSSAMSTNQSRASGPLTCASTSSSPTLTVGCSKTSGSVNWNRSARPLSEALGAPGCGPGPAVGLDEITRQPLHAELRVLAAQRRPFGTRRPGQAAHGQVGGQLGELAVVQLQPGAAAQAAGHGQRRQPGRPGQRLQIVGLQIELSAPVGGVARVARETGRD